MAGMHVDAIAQSVIPAKCAQYLLALTENDSEVAKLYAGWRKKLNSWMESDLDLLASLETAHKLLAIYMAYSVQYNGEEPELPEDDGFLSSLYEEESDEGPRDLGRPIFDLKLLDSYDALLWSLSEVVEQVLGQTPTPNPELPE